MMSRAHLHRPRLVAPVHALLIGLAVSLASGCAGKVTDPWIAGSNASGPGSQQSVATTPRRLIDAIALDWSHLDGSGYADRLTDDYQFVDVAADSVTAYFHYGTLSRELEREAVQRMFETGTANLAPFESAVLTFDPTFVTEPDPRPGKAFPWHQLARVNYVLLANAPDAAYRITGAASFYVVRGDSAQIPPELIARGVKPDPGQWWLERWEDYSYLGPASSTAMPLPARQFTLGLLKAMYLSDSLRSSPRLASKTPEGIPAMQVVKP